MKRKALMAVLALAGGTAIVGSGFSAWFFESNEITANNSVKTHVTELADGLGTLTDNNAGKNLYVILDQGGAKNTELTKGISITESDTTPTDAALGTNVASFGCTYAATAEQSTNLKNAGITSGKITATITLSAKAAEYLEWKSTAQWTADDNVTTDTTKIVGTHTVSFTGEAVNKVVSIETDTVSGVNKLLQYKAGKKPTTAAAYTTMKDDLDTTQLLTIDYKFEVTIA